MRFVLCIVNEKMSYDIKFNHWTQFWSIPADIKRRQYKNYV